MKNLKHYFSSPNNNTSANGSSDREVVVETLLEKVKSDLCQNTKLKKKRRKRKLSDSSIAVIEEIKNEILEPIEKKKRRKSLERINPINLINETINININSSASHNETRGKRSKKKSEGGSCKKTRGSGSSKENSTTGSDIEETTCITPENTKNIFRYFNKIDKLPEISEKPRKIKVQAIVHADDSGSPPSSTNGKAFSRKKRKSKKRNYVIDFDLITSEEDPSANISTHCMVPSKLNDVPINMGSQEVTVNLVDDDSCIDIAVENSNESVSSNTKSFEQLDADVIVVSEIPKERATTKHNGTLVSFLNLGNKLSPATTQRKSLAKQLFLTSGNPTAVKKKPTTLSCEGSVAAFPAVSHVQQKDKMNIMWNLKPVKFDFSNKSYALEKFPLWSSLLQKTTDENILCPENKKPFDAKATLKELKKELNLFPIWCWHKELKKMKKVNRGIMWTERYRPRTSSAFLANSRSISRLKSWLTELKESSNAESGMSSGDDFLKDDDERRQFEKKTVALLTGPPGTGKTAAVYAVAEEVGYNVIEINASCHRSGKRILNEFSEAMQSHKVRVSKLNFSKVKKKTEEPKRSLLLVEDADLLFHDDEGFVPALMNLGASTKRPIILVANNPEPKHFGKLSTLFHSTLTFLPPTQDRLGSWLRTVSAVEGFHLGHYESMKLASSQDLRKSLLQLQLTQSYAKESSCSDKETLTWERAGTLNLSSKKERLKATRVMSTLADLDIIKQERWKETVPYWRKPLEDSTLCAECFSMPSQYLDGIEASLLGLISSSSDMTSDNQYHEVPRNMLDVEKDVCSKTSVLNRRGISLDYWPTLRQISRSESLRLASHTKRNNRFFNYLSSLGVSGTPDFIESLSSPFS